MKEASPIRHGFDRLEKPCIQNDDEKSCLFLPVLLGNEGSGTGGVRAGSANHLAGSRTVSGASAVTHRSMCHPI